MREIQIYDDQSPTGRFDHVPDSPRVPEIFGTVTVVERFGILIGIGPDWELTQIRGAAAQPEHWNSQPEAKQREVVEAARAAMRQRAKDSLNTPSEVAGTEERSPDRRKAHGLYQDQISTAPWYEVSAWFAHRSSNPNRL